MPSEVKDYLNETRSRLERLEFKVNSLETTLDLLIDNPKYVSSDEIGFNGQAIRKKIFNDLLSTFNFDFLAETGTWTGNTTGYMAEVSRLPVLTTELDHRYHSVAKTRLADFDNIRLEELDSRRFIEKLTYDPALVEKCAFFYLDAHWNEDLPLREEIELIARNWEQFVVLVDDFKVPGDEGYGYDDYGQGKVLSLGSIEPLLNQYGLVPFFPARPSSEETGNKRGCIVLARRGTMTEKLESVSSLKSYEGGGQE